MQRGHIVCPEQSATRRHLGIRGRSLDGRGNLVARADVGGFMPMGVARWAARCAAARLYAGKREDFEEPRPPP